MAAIKQVTKILGDSLPFPLTNQKVDLPELQGDTHSIARGKCRLAAEQVCRRYWWARSGNNIRKWWSVGENTYRYLSRFLFGPVRSIVSSRSWTSRPSVPTSRCNISKLFQISESFVNSTKCDGLSNGIFYFVAWRWCRETGVQDLQSSSRATQYHIEFFKQLFVFRKRSTISK